uniref:Uncharacterized protein n=1 Tax=Anopheles minimus TaxID=112268 RepID=A0A182WH15_9DIPT
MMTPVHKLQTKQHSTLLTTDAAPRYQVLKPREGYVPVYIRLGDQPLADINPELAAAFREPVSRVSRAELAHALQADQGVDHSSSLVDSHSASDEHKVLLADALPDKYKDYPKKGGYVPVYVRYPNQPLGSISPELAAAFQESSGRSSRGKLIQELNRPVRFSSESSSDEELRNDITATPRVDPNSSESDSHSNESISNEKEAKEAIKQLLKQMSKISKAAAAKTKKA